MKKVMSKESFLATKVVGMILRAYATSEADIPQRIKMVQDAIAAAHCMTVNGKQLIRRIDVMIWADKNFAQSDCGKTAPALRKALKGEPGVFVSNVEHGDIFCGILNYGIVHQLRKGVDYSIIASAEAFSYMTPETATDMVNAACKGALSLPVAINELTSSILEGRGANTFQMWHNESLMTIGGFDLRAAKPNDDRTAHFMKGWDANRGDVYYHLAGVEEVIPLARMVQTFGPCIAPILPSGEGMKQYIMPDPTTQPEEYARQLAKFGTKRERQAALLASIGCDTSVLKGGVMEEYRRF